jgi:hypothetical protein
VDLLGRAIGPVRRNVVRCELHADPPLTVGVNDTVPTVVLEDPAAKDPGPERTLRMQVRRVEHDDLTHHPHADNRIGRTSHGFNDGNVRLLAQRFRWRRRSLQRSRNAVNGAPGSTAVAVRACSSMSPSLNVTVAQEEWSPVAVRPQQAQAGQF